MALEEPYSSVAVASRLHHLLEAKFDDSDDNLQTVAAAQSQRPPQAQYDPVSTTVATDTDISTATHCTSCLRTSHHQLAGHHSNNNCPSNHNAVSGNRGNAGVTPGAGGGLGPGCWPRGGTLTLALAWGHPWAVGMGRGLGAGRRLSRAHSSTPRIPVAPSLVIVCLAVVSMVIPTVTDAQFLRPSGSRSSGSLSPERQLCDIVQCWGLYSDAQDYYNIVYEPSQTSLDPEKLPALCITQRTFYKCLSKMYDNKSLDCHSNIGFRSAFNGIERSMDKNNCSQNGIIYDPSEHRPTPDSVPVCTYNGPPRMRFCSLFGDPHLWTFSDQFQTCQVQGAWPMLDNRYLTVQVTSKAVGAASGPATAITELTVMIKAHDDCGADRFVTYQADASLLPSTFDDGSAHFGPARSVILREIVPGREIMIFLRYIETTVVVRRYHAFLTVSLLMPEKILNQSTSHLPRDADEVEAVRTLELCSQGCPKPQQIQYMEYLARAETVRLLPAPESQQPTYLFAEEKNSIEGMEVVMTRDQALRLCQELGLVDFFLDSCVFDLMNTGDVVFMDAAVNAQKDLVRLHPDGASVLENRTWLLELPDIPSSAAISGSGLSRTSRTFHNYLAMVVALVTCALTRWLAQCGSVLALNPHLHIHRYNQHIHHQNHLRFGSAVL